MPVDFSQYQDEPSVDFSQYQDGAAQQSAPQESYLHSAFVTAPKQIGGDILAGLATAGNDFNHSVLNAGQAIGRAMNPMSNIGSTPSAPISNMLPSRNTDWSSTFGIPNPGIADRLIQGASGLAPYGLIGGGALGAASDIAGAAPLTMRMASGALTGALHGATQQNPLTAVPLEASLGGAAMALPDAAQLGGQAIQGIGKGAEAVTNLFRPKAYSKQIVNNLGVNGSFEDTTKSLASDLKNAFQQRQAQAAMKYDQFNDPQISNAPLYDATPPYAGIHPYKTFDTKYQNVGYTEAGNQNPFGIKELDDLHQDFLNNPNYQNGQELQSQLGNYIGRLKRQSVIPGNNSIQLNDNITQLSQARNSLIDDMTGRLNQIKPGLGQDYSDAAQFYKENVTPYLSDTNLTQIVKGSGRNALNNPTPAQIKGIFSYPEEGISNVANDIGDTGKNKILFTSLGQHLNDRSGVPQFMNSVDNLNQQGLNSYKTPEFENQMRQLQYRQWAKRIGFGIPLERLYHKFF